MRQNDQVTTGLQCAHPAPDLARRRTAGALAAAAVLAAALLIGTQQSATAAAVAEVAPTAAAVVGAAPASTSAAGVSLTVDPATGLSNAGSTLEVTGSGYKSTGGLYVAICHADGKAPASLEDCVGGAIPKSNPSSSWAHITSGGTAAAGDGPVVGKWGPGGKFSVALKLPAFSTASDALNCSKVVCAVYTTSDAPGSDAGANLSVPLTYQAVPPTTSSTVRPSTTTTSSTASSTSSTASTATASSGGTASSTSSTATASSTATMPTTAPASSTISSIRVVTSTIRSVASTVKPKLIGSDPATVGGDQQILFAGFAKGETVDVTLFSAPRPLPAVKADTDGIVTVNFKIPADLQIGTHLLRVVGKTSRVTGLASFQVAAAPATRTSAPAPPTSASVSSAGQSAPSSEAGTSALGPVFSGSISSVPESSRAPATSAPALVAPTSAAGSRLIWPLVLLGLFVLLGIIFAAFLLNRRRRMAAELQEKEHLLADGAVQEQERSAEAVARANADTPTAYIGPPPTDRAGSYGGYTGYHPGEHGLLAGRDDPENPGMLSGGYHQNPAGPGGRPVGNSSDTGELPTTYSPPGPTPGTPLAQDPTAPWRSDFQDGGPTGGRPHDAGPPTGHWRPDFDGDGPGEQRGDSSGDQPGGRHSR